MIHMDMNENETETNQDIFNKVIEECPDITYPSMMKDFGHYNHYDSKRNVIIEEG